MSIYRHINGKNNDRDFLHRKKEYIIDPLKTNGGALVDASNYFISHDLDDWFAVKKVYQKSGGRQGEHSVLSVTKGMKKVIPEELLKVAQDVAETIYDGYQCLYAVHTDSTYPHIHLLANSVSFTDGKRFHIANGELAGIRLKINKILESYGYDKIVSRADQIVDNTPYDLSQGFDSLEIADDEPYVDSFRDILAEPEDKYFDEDANNASKKIHIELYTQDESDDISPYSDVFTNKIFLKEAIKMANSNSKNTGYTPVNNYNKTSYVPAVQQNAYQSDRTYTANGNNTVGNNVPAVSQNAVSQGNRHFIPLTEYDADSQSIDNNALPELHFRLSSSIKLVIPENTSPEIVRAYINASLQGNNRIDPFKTGADLMATLQEQEVDCNISFDLYPAIELEIKTDSNNSVKNNDLKSKPLCIYQPNFVCVPNNQYLPCGRGQYCERCHK